MKKGGELSEFSVGWTETLVVGGEVGRVVNWNLARCLGMFQSEGLVRFLCGKYFD